MSGLCEHVLNSKCAPQDLDTPDAPRIKQIEDMLNSTYVYTVLNSVSKSCIHTWKKGRGVHMCPTG